MPINVDDLPGDDDDADSSKVRDGFAVTAEQLNALRTVSAGLAHTKFGDMALPRAALAQFGTMVSVQTAALASVAIPNIRAGLNVFQHVEMPTVTTGFFTGFQEAMRSSSVLAQLNDFDYSAVLRAASAIDWAAVASAAQERAEDEPIAGTVSVVAGMDTILLVIIALAALCSGALTTAFYRLGPDDPTRQMLDHAWQFLIAAGFFRAVKTSDEDH